MVKNDRYSAPIIKNVSGPLLNHKKRLKLNKELGFPTVNFFMSISVVLPYPKVPKIFTGIGSYNIVREELKKLY
jgi:hypothetical protein